jgi:hypothetical protein
MSNTAQQLELYDKIQLTMQELQKLVGPRVWDYAFLFDAGPINSINFQSLNLRTEQLINEFIDQVNVLLEMASQEKINGEDIAENFTNALHAYYSIRFLEARMLLAEYELLRILTITEDKILDAANEDKTKMSESFSIYIPNAIKTNERGEVDIDATMQFEQQQNLIKSHLSCVTEVNYFAPKFAQKFEDYSTVSVAVYLYQDDFIELFQFILNSFLLKVSQAIYDYLNKGYNLEQAKLNVYDYFKSILNKQNLRFAPYFKEMEEEMISNSKEILDGMPNLEQSTKETLIWEAQKLMIEEFLNGNLFPRNYYDIELRLALKDRETESSYSHICDTFPLQSTGRMTEFAIESYALSLTPESKAKIFSYVVNGLENPDQPLEKIIKYI